MKGPEEKEHHASSCSADWLVEQSRNSMSNGDVYAAKAWLLTAKTLYPKAFSVQYEAFMMEKRTGRLSTCGKLFFEMIKVFPKEEVLWRELRKVVQSQEVNASELDVETKFLRDMTESLSVKYQRELLLHYADNQKDLIEKCRISLVVMKKFQGGTKQYGVKLTELLSRAEKDEPSPPLNIYRKMLVCDVLPVILKSSEVQVDVHGLKHKNNVVYLEEKILFHWIELCFEFYVSLSIHQSALKYRHGGNALEPNMSVIDPDGDIGQNPWQSLHEVLLLFAAKSGWTNVLKIKDKLDPSKSRSIRSKWRALSNSKDTKSPWGLFYCVLELYYYAVIEYCSKMIISQTGQQDSEVLEYVLLEKVDQLGQGCHNQQSLSRPKKRKRMEEGSVPTSEFQSEDVIIQFTSMHSGQNVDVSDILQVAMDCRNFLISINVFHKELLRLEADWCVSKWLWIDIFEIDSLLYQRKYHEIVEMIQKKQQIASKEGFSSPTLSAKQFTQLAVALYCIGEHKEACEMAINGINAVSKADRGKQYARQGFLASSAADGRCLQAISCTQHEIIAYCIDVIILCLKERLPNVEIRPDKDKIGPLFETRNDDIIGHLIVLLQYNWPKWDTLFEQLIKMVITFGGLKYKEFFSYVINIDILEEFAYLNTLEKVQLELQETNQGDSSRKTITRGVNRENKEDFRTALDDRVSSIDESIEDVILTFLTDQKQSLVI